jgi:hypothetical protein
MTNVSPQAGAAAKCPLLATERAMREMRGGFSQNEAIFLLGLTGRLMIALEARLRSN